MKRGGKRSNPAAIRPRNPRILAAACRRDVSVDQALPSFHSFRISIRCHSSLAIRESDSRKRCTRRPCRLFRETAHVRAIYGASPEIGLGAFDRTEKHASGITSEPEKYRDTRARTQRAWQEMTRNVIQMNTA